MPLQIAYPCAPQEVPLGCAFWPYPLLHWSNAPAAAQGAIFAPFVLKRSKLSICPTTESAKRVVYATDLCWKKRGSEELSLRTPPLHTSEKR